jgi:anti-sigma regulatory factor (Ser/Thr protein kinase)
MALQRRWQLARVRELSSVRDEVRAELLAAGVDRSIVADLVVVVSELVTNGLQAAGLSRAGVSLHLAVDESTGEIELVIRNLGGDFVPPGAGAGHPPFDMPPVSDVGGRGLAVAAALSDELEITPLIGGTQVRVSRRSLRQDGPSGS